MSFHERLRAARVEANITQTAAAEYLQKKGFPIKPYTISNWEMGKRAPGSRELLSLCDLYNIADIRYTLTGQLGILRSESLLDGLNHQGRENAKAYIDFLKSKPSYTDWEIFEPRVFRLYDLPVSAGTGTYLDSSEYEEITADDLIPDDMDYAVRVSGDSMEPQYFNGQIVFIKEQETLENGEIGIFYLNGDAYLKMLKDDTLVSLNKKYKPIKILEHDEFRVFGKVIGVN